MDRQTTVDIITSAAVALFCDAPHAQRRKYLDRVATRQELKGILQYLKAAQQPEQRHLHAELQAALHMIVNRSPDGSDAIGAVGEHGPVAYIRFFCLFCSAPLRARAETCGKPCRCARCAQVMTTPQTSTRNARERRPTTPGPAQIIACPVCQTQNVVTLGARQGSLLRCGRCGSKFVNPQPLSADGSLVSAAEAQINQSCGEQPDESWREIFGDLYEDHAAQTGLVP